MMKSKNRELEKSALWSKIRQINFWCFNFSVFKYIFQFLQFFDCLITRSLTFQLFDISVFRLSILLFLHFLVWDLDFLVLSIFDFAIFKYFKFSISRFLDTLNFRFFDFNLSIFGIFYFRLNTYQMLNQNVSIFRLFDIWIFRLFDFSISRFTKCSISRFFDYSAFRFSNFSFF